MAHLPHNSGALSPSSHHATKLHHHLSLHHPHLHSSHHHHHHHLSPHTLQQQQQQQMSSQSMSSQNSNNNNNNNNINCNTSNSSNASTPNSNTSFLIKDILRYDGQKRKQRKARTAFSDHQLKELEASFEAKKYLTVQDRVELANKLKLSDTQVKTWYQNRRTKHKRQTAVGLELLNEAGHYLAYQSVLERSGPWLLSQYANPSAQLNVAVSLLAAQAQAAQAQAAAAAVGNMGAHNFGASLAAHQHQQQQQQQHQQQTSSTTTSTTNNTTIASTPPSRLSPQIDHKMSLSVDGK